MSGWLDRFDSKLVTAAELRRLDHRTRVAWVYYGVTAIAARMSEYFTYASGLGQALQAAKAFIVDGTIDGEQITAVNAQLLAAFEQLEHEGYEQHEFQMAGFLLDAICGESNLPAGRVRHTTCDAACEQTVTACEWCQSSAGVVYTVVTQWVRGVGACKLPDGPLDDIMAQFFRFEREVYSVLVDKPPVPLPLGGLPRLALSWDLPDAIEAEIIRTAWKPPPVHEKK